MSKGPHLVLLLGLAGLLFFLGLGTLGLTDRDEGRNAEAAREMLETGNWISPTYNYEPRFAKPAFVYWLMSGGYRILGVSEFTARLPSALFGMALILLQYLFLARIRGPEVGLLGALMLLLNPEIVALGRMALTDSALIFFTTLALFGFWLGLQGSMAQTEGRGSGARHYFWLFYLGMAFGTLTKGPVGAAVPLLAVVPYLTLARQWGLFWKRGFPLVGLLTFVVIATPWYAAMFAIHGLRYAASAQVHTLGRFLDPMEGHGFTVFFYVPVLLIGFFPWSGLLPAALYQAFKNWREAKRKEREVSFTSPYASPLTPHEDLELFAALWVAGVFLFFSLSATRLPHYIAPLFPAAAILTASYWSRCLVRPATRGIRASIHTIIGLGFALALGFALLPWLYSRFIEKIAKEFPAASRLNPSDLYTGPYLTAAVLVIGMTLVGYFGLSESRRAGTFWIAGATIGLAILIAIQATLPQANRYFVAPPQELAYAAGVNLGPGDRLLVYGVSRPSLVFYARRKVEYFSPGEETRMRLLLTQPGQTMILLPARLRQTLPAEAAGFPIILQRYGYLLLGNEAMVKQIPSTQPSTSPRPTFSH